MAQRPWWENLSLEQLEQLPPDVVATLPPEVLSKFRNEFFLKNPTLTAKLSEERLGGTGQYQGTGFSQEARNLGFGPKVLGPGVISEGNLVQGGQSVPLPPAINTAISGGQLPLYRSQGNLPFFAPQTLANMTPSERESLGVLANRTGGRAEDFFERSKRLGAMQGGPTLPRYQASSGVNRF